MGPQTQLGVLTRQPFALLENKSWGLSPGAIVQLRSGTVVGRSSIGLRSSKGVLLFPAHSFSVYLLTLNSEFLLGSAGNNGSSSALFSKPLELFGIGLLLLLPKRL